MSIEKLIEENIAATKELARQFAQFAQTFGNLTISGVDLKPPTKEDGEKIIAHEKEKAAEAKAETKKLTAETASPAKDATPPASEKKDSASEAGEVDYETVKVPFLLWAAKDKPAAKALLEKVGAKNLTSATAEQRKAIFDAIPKADEDLS